MDKTFNRLLARGTFQKAKNVCDPWEFIPIKNRKQARDCTEMHCANRGFEVMNDNEFQNFLNLEVLYLNDNAFEKIEGLDANFRIKHIFLFNNKLKTLEGSLEYLTHLETILAYNNELRDLDKQIEFLKRYPNLKQLDLFQNPICEEPNYRAKIIYFLPQLKTLDRHVISYQERMKANKTIQELSQKYLFQNNNKNTKKKIPPSQMFSQGEVDCYKEAASLRRKYKKEEDDRIQMEETIKQQKIQRKKEKEQNKVPRTEYQIKLETRRKNDPNHIITEYEKDKINFIYDKYKHQENKELYLKKEDIPKIYNDLEIDEGLIGIIPTCTCREFEEIINPDEKDMVEYDLYRLRLNNMFWDRATPERTQEIINKLYKQGNQKMNRGQKSEALIDINNAIRLQTKQDMDQHKEMVFENMSKSDIGKQRYDSFDFGRFTFKRTFQNTAKQVL